MKLKKLRFKEMRIPRVTFYSLCLSFVLIILGIVANFLVIINNQGRMPVWNLDNINTESHFTITNLSEVNYLYFADIFPFKNVIWSLGDFLMLFGFFFSSLAMFVLIYNFTINLCLYFKRRKQWKLG